MYNHDIQNAMAGKKIYQTRYVTNAVGEHIDKAVFEAQDALEGFAIGHAMESKTKCINYHIIEIAAGD